MQKSKAAAVRKRALSILLALAMVIMSVPSDLFSLPARADTPFFGFGMPGFGMPGFGWGAPNVLTNATVKFKDSSGTNITSVESGEAFKMVITISGNNAISNGSTSYMLEVPDSILLTNFRGNGFTNGAKYNGYTLRYDPATGKRYVEFSVKNGSTQTIQLSGMFANGITEDGTVANVKLVTNDIWRLSTTGSITAKSNLSWNDDKSTSTASLESKDFATGKAEFKLSAAPSGPSSETGVLWADKLEFTDTIVLPAGLTFKSADDVKAALSISGVTIESVTLSGSDTAVVKWSKENTNTKDGVPYAEMDPFSADATLALNCIQADDSFTGGKLKNTLDVKAYGYNSDTPKDLGEKSAEIPIKASQPDVSDLKKTLVNVETGKSYAMSGDTVTFNIKNTNTGGKALSNFSITDVVSDDLTFVKFVDKSSTADVTFTGTAINVASFAPGETIDVDVVCRVKDGAADGNGSNTATNSENFSSTAHVPIKSAKDALDISKTADTAQILSGVDKIVTYRIVVSNTGTTDLKDVLLEDNLAAAFPINSELLSAEASNGVAISLENFLSGSGVNIGDLASEESVTITLRVKLNAEGEENAPINNNASASCDAPTNPGTKLVAQDDAVIKVHVGQPNITANKTGYVLVTEDGNTSRKSFYQNGADALGETQDIIYTITVGNNGEAAAKQVVIDDEDIADLTDKLETTPTFTLSLDGNEEPIPGLPYTIENLAVNSTAIVTVKFADVSKELTISETDSEFLKNDATVQNGGTTKNVSDTVEVRKAEAILGINKFSNYPTYTEGHYKSNSMNMASDVEFEGREGRLEWYHIKVSNSGTQSTGPLKLEDQLPDWIEEPIWTIDLETEDGARELKGAWPESGIVELAPLEPGQAYEIEIWGYMKDGTTGPQDNTAHVTDLDTHETKDSSVSITQTEFQPGSFEKTADVADSNSAHGKFIDVSGGTITYELKYTGNNYIQIDDSNRFPFGITFTDFLPMYQDESGGDVLNIKSVKLVFDDPDTNETITREIPSKEYLLDGNKLTYVFDKNTNPSMHLCKSFAKLVIEYKVGDLNTVKDGAPTELVNNGQLNMAGKQFNSEVTTPVIDKNAMKVDKFAKQEGSLDSVPDKLSGGIIDEELGTVGAGNTITYYIKVTNSSKRPWTKLNVYDLFKGKYKPSDELKVTVADVSGSSVIEKGDSFTAKFTGQWQTANDASNSASESSSTAYNSNIMFKEGGDFNPFQVYTTKDNGFLLDISSKDNSSLLDPNGYVVFAYQLTTHDIPLYFWTNEKFEEGSNDVYTSYTGTSDELLDQSSPFHDQISYNGNVPSLLKGIGGNETVDDNQHKLIITEIDDTLTETSLAYTESELKSKTYDYTIGILNKSKETYIYDNTITYRIKDAVPAGMEIVPGSVKAYIGTMTAGENDFETINEYTKHFNHNISGVELALPYDSSLWDGTVVHNPGGEIDPSKVNLSYESDGSVSIIISDTTLNYNGEKTLGFVVTYQLKLSDNTVTELVKKKANGETIIVNFPNSAYAEMVKNFGSESEYVYKRTNEDTATLKFQEETIAPGVEKEGESVSDVIMPDNNWGNGAKWTIRVSNNDDDELEIVDMAGFTVKDTIPVGSRFYGLACDEAISISDATPGTFPEDEYADAMKASWTASTGAAGEIDAYFYDENGTKGAKVTSPDGTGGKIIGFRFDEGTLTLKKGEYVDITFYTSNADYDAELDSWITPVGSVTNHVDVTFDDGFSNKTVKKGTYEGNKTVWAEATEQIGGINTLSYKTIQYADDKTGLDYEKDSNGQDIDHGYGDAIHHLSDDLFDEADTEEYSRVVQGRQGKEVLYTINVKNGAKPAKRNGESLSAGESCMENISLIDRLPFVGDKGIITYERGSAFAVEFDSAKGLDISIRRANGADEIVNDDQYKLTFSSGNENLDEYSGDWAGENDVMQWDEEYTPTATTFRIVFDESIVLDPGDYISVGFAGKVSPFTDVTAKSTQDAIENNKVAWNSFAYSYKTHDTKTGLSWDDTVVSEPAMVGVWVKESEAKITVNKTYKTNSTEENTFWFSLFTKDGDTFKPYGTPKSLTMTGSEEGNTETLEFNNLVPTETLYVFETDKEGNILKSTPEQKITYNGTEFVSEAAEVENALVGEHDEKTNVEQLIISSEEIDHTNWSEWKQSIDKSNDSTNITKNGEKEFTLSGDLVKAGGTLVIEYVPGGDTGSIQLNVGGNYTELRAGQKATFATDGTSIIINNINFYRPNNEAPNDVVNIYNTTRVSGMTDLNVDITNELIVGTIEVEKTLIPAYNGTKDTFYFGAFLCDAEGKLLKDGESYRREGDIQSVTIQGKTAGSPVKGEKITFHNLPIAEEGSYYAILETNAKGVIAQEAIIPDDKIANDYVYEAESGRQYDAQGDSPISLSKDDNVGNSYITNEELKIFKLDVTKNYDGSDAADKSFRVGVFEIPEENDILRKADPTDEELETLDAIDRTDLNSFALYKSMTANVKDGETASFDIPEDGAYYVFELDADDKPIAHGTKIENYTVLYSDGAQIIQSEDSDEYIASYMPVSLSADHTSESVSITNTTKTIQPELTVTKYLAIDGYTAATGVTQFNMGIFRAATYTADEAAEYNSGKPESEQVKAGAPKFDENGDLVLEPVEVETEDANGNITDPSTTFSVTVEAANGKTTSSSVKVLLPEMSLADFAPITYYVYEVDGEGKPIGSGQTVDTQITGADDAKAIVSYDSEGGVVFSQTNTSDSAAVLNAVSRETQVSFLKWNEEGDQLEGAILQLTKEDGFGEAEFPANAVMAGESIRSTGDEPQSFTVADDSAAWLTDGAPFTVKNLPDGTYTLNELFAPGEYSKAGEKTFTISGGYIDTEESVSDDLYSFTANSVSVTNKISAGPTLTISKVGINGEDEVNGATITIEGDFDAADITNVSGEKAPRVDITDGKITWVSNGTDVVIQGLPQGTYTLTETAEDKITDESGNVYTVIKTSLTFDIAEDGTASVSEDNEGTIVTDTTTSEGYLVESDKITVCDAVRDDTVIISKRDAGGAEIANAELIIFRYENSSYETKQTLTAEDITDISITRGETSLEAKIKDGGLTFALTEAGKSTVIKGLEDGFYELHEQTAPENYAVATDIRFEIRNGEVYLISAETTGATSTKQEDRTIVMTDESLYDVKISKLDAVNGSNVEGAELKLEKVGTVAKNNDDTYSQTFYQVGEEKLISEWTSDGNDYEVEVTDGVYKLTEVTSPDGYDVAEDIYFVVSGGKVIYSSSNKPLSDITAADLGNKVKMLDKPTKASISKQDAAGSEELPGAKLTITAPEDADLSRVYALNNEITIEGNKITFISKDEATEIYGLPEGVYTLEEDTAPLGYKVNSEAVTFDVDVFSYVSTEDERGSNAVMVDELMTANISKRSITGQDELDGAMLTIKALDEQNLKDVTAYYIVTGEDYEISTDATTSVVTREYTSTATSVVQARNADGSAKTDESGEPITEEHVTEITFQSGNAETILSRLWPGRYELIENTAPAGYDKLDGTIKFTVDKLGIITIDEAPDGHGELDGSTVIMRDDAIISISKMDITGQAELKGAKLTLTGVDSEGASITFDKSAVDLGDEADFTDNTDTSKLEWKSGISATTIKNLPDGTYTLHESADTEGGKLVKLTDASGTEAEYTVIESDLTFKVKDGMIVAVDQFLQRNAEADNTSDSYYAVEEGNMIYACDSMFTRSLQISKQAAAEGGAVNVEGAELTLTNDTLTNNDWERIIRANGTKLTAVYDEDDSEKIIGVKYISTAADDTIIGLPDGDYSLKETASPDGLLKINSTFGFNISGAKISATSSVTEGNSKIEATEGSTRIVVLDDISKITITKTFETVGTTMPVATLQLTMLSADKSAEKPDSLFGNAIWTDDEPITWTTEESNPMVLTGLLDGRYVLSEIRVPEAYYKADDIYFVIRDGKAYLETADEETRTVADEPFDPEMINVATTTSTTTTTTTETTTTETTTTTTETTTTETTTTTTETTTTETTTTTTETTTTETTTTTTETTTTETTTTTTETTVTSTTETTVTTTSTTVTTKTIVIDKVAVNGDDEIKLDEENRAHFKLTVVSLDDETQKLDTIG
ncbi:MAG TPA: hypothetical protein DCZ62_03540, partial [Ruminococcus sp.]|nr:hypothetical protein [Ruminococcus sp.]